MGVKEISSVRFWGRSRPPPRLNESIGTGRGDADTAGDAAHRHVLTRAHARTQTRHHRSRSLTAHKKPRFSLHVAVNENPLTTRSSSPSSW